VQLSGIYLNEAALRAGVEQRRRKEIDDETWRALLRLDAVSEALDRGFRDEQEDYILGLIEGESHTDPRNDSEGRRTDDGERDREEAAAYFMPDLGEHEKKRARAYAAFVTGQVSQYQDVWGFREELLEGRTLEPEEAYAFLESPATCYFPYHVFKALGTPIVGHAAEVISYDFDYKGTEVDHRVTVRFDPPGTAKTARYAPHWLPRDETVDVEVCAYEDPRRTVVKSPESWPLAYRASDGFKETAYPWPRSVLSELRTRARALAKRLGWTEEDVVWLLLNGEAPYLAPLKVGLSYSRGKPPTIKMEAAAWMPVEVVARNFRNIQCQVLTRGSDKLPVRSLEVCAFVEENIQSANEKAVWPDLWNKWNAQNPQKRYAGYNGFRQAYVRNIPKVMQSYEYPNLKPSPAVQKRDKELAERWNRVLRAHTEKHGNRQFEEIE
jgi:hypothetical protein